MKIKQRPTVVVIGAGVAGLTAGINGEQNGLHCVLLESQPEVGGLCTGWYRRGRYIDGCIHWLTGTNPNTDLYKMWKNVKAITSDEDIIYLDSFGAFEYEGTVVNFYRDVDKAEKEWISISPVDKKEIKHFFKMVRDFMSVDTPALKPASNLPFKTLLKTAGQVVKVWPSYLLSMGLHTDEYANKFKHPALRFALKNIQPGEGNLFSMIYSYSTITYDNGGIPKGGSKAMVERMKDYFIELGGTLKVSSPVDKILTRDNKVYGVKLTNGEIIECDYVITTVSPEIVMNDFLDCRYIIPSFIKRLKNYHKNATPGCALLSFDIEDLPSDLPVPLNWAIKPFKCGTREIDVLNFRSFAYEKDLYCKDNKTVVGVLIDQYDEDYYYWENLYYKHKEQYYQVKKELAETVIDRIIQRFPSLEGKITCLDVATPHTFKRYTNSTRGAYMSFLFSKKNTLYSASQIRGLSNLYLAGQWVYSPGGVPFALMSGYHSIFRICQKENIKYLLESKPKLKFNSSK